MPDPPDRFSIHVDGLSVAGQTVVRVVPQQDRGKVPLLLCDRLMTVSFAPESDPLERPGKPALRCLALDDRIPLSRAAPVVGKPEKVECLVPSFLYTAVRPFKTYHFCFVWMNG